MHDIIALRHLRFENLGVLEKILAARALSFEYVEAPREAIDEIDPAGTKLLVVLGGPISAYDEELYPFLRSELKLLERRLRLNKPVLGICLGAQLIARALGARVYPSGTKEIGWGPLELTSAGQQSPLRHLEETPVLHWHGDTFELPDGAVHLASTPVCFNQAFSWGQHALGLQFHAEVLADSLEEWFVGHALEIQSAGIPISGLRGGTRRWGSELERQGSRCLSEWLDQVLPLAAHSAN